MAIDFFLTVWKHDRELTISAEGHVVSEHLQEGVRATDEVAVARRKFLASCGKFAAVTPPAITLLLSTSMSSTATAASGGGSGGGDGGLIGGLIDKIL